MALILPPNWCLVFFRDPESKFTSAQVKKILEGRGLTVTGTAEPFSIQWEDGPTLSASIQRGKSIETVLRGLVGRSRKYAQLVPGCDAQITIVLSNVVAVLDEINTLIELQATLQDATQGLMYTSWNQKFSAPGEQ
jgi:hypothetical protein